MTQTIGALQKALNVIDEMAKSGHDVGISELARRLSMSKNQVFRILSTLKEYGYVHQADDKTYRLGIKFFEVGQRVVEQNDLVQAAITVMDDVRDRTGETVHLFVRDGLQAVCVARRESTAFVSLSAQVGRRFLLHAGACPKVILAFHEPSIVDAVVAEHGLPAYTPGTIVDRGTLERHLAEIRAQGYAESDEDLDPSGYSIAIPLMGPDGIVNAAMSSAGPLSRFTRAQREQGLTCLVAARDRIYVALGMSMRPWLRDSGPAVPRYGGLSLESTRRSHTEAISADTD